jgi:methyl-accepting chemotaxis protein
MEFLNRLTYRRRFLLFALIFFLCVPPALYVVVQKIQVKIENKKSRFLSLKKGALEKQEEDLINSLIGLLQEGNRKNFQSALKIYSQTYPERRSQLIHMETALAEFLNPDESLAAQENLKMSVIDAVAEILQDSIRSLHWIRNGLITLFCLSALLILAFVWLRALSSHFKRLANHIEELARGDIFLEPASITPFKNEKDDFLRARQLLEKRGQETVSGVSRILQFNQKTQEVQTRLALAIHEGEEGLRKQEERLQELERTMQEIATKCQRLSQGMPSSRSEKDAPVDEGLKQLQIHMGHLVQEAARIVTLMKNVEEKVAGMNQLITFMTKVSERAYKLSRNAFIETANVTIQRESFTSITQKIQRFALHTGNSTQEIHTIFEQMLANVGGVKTEAINCSQEIHEGAEQLLPVNSQLKRLTEREREQKEKCGQYGQMIEDQLSQVARVTETLNQMRTSAAANGQLARTLQESLDQFGTHMRELRRILKRRESSGKLPTAKVPSYGFLDLFSYRSKFYFILFFGFLPVIPLLILLLQDPSLTLLPLILGSLFVAIASLKMRHPLHPLLEALQRNDFSYRLPVSDPTEFSSIATAYNHLSELLDGFWSDMRRLSLQLKSSSKAVFDMARQLEENIDSQIALTRQIATGLRGLLGSFETLDDELICASRGAVATSLLALGGDKGLQQMESIMQEMLTSSFTIVKTLSSLQDEVATINKVIVAMVKIADQSNLLSLNTAIRARKSGSEGRGFSVIADRIREMANQIAGATLDIEHSVEQIVTAVLEASEGVRLFSEQIGQQVQETKETSTQLKTLIDNTQEQMQRFESIKSEIQQQIRQITLLTEITGHLKREANSSHQLAGRLRREMQPLLQTEII